MSHLNSLLDLIYKHHDYCQWCFKMCHNINTITKETTISCETKCTMFTLSYSGSKVVYYRGLLVFNIYDEVTHMKAIIQN